MWRQGNFRHDPAGHSHANSAERQGESRCLHPTLAWSSSRIPLAFVGSLARQHASSRRERLLRPLARCSRAYLDGRSGSDPATHSPVRSATSSASRRLTALSFSASRRMTRSPRNSETKALSFFSRREPILTTQRCIWLQPFGPQAIQPNSFPMSRCRS